MRKHLTFDERIETKKAYLTRMARLLNVIRNHPEQINECSQISGMISEEEKEFQKSLEGTGVTRKEYNAVLKKLERLNENF